MKIASVHSFYLGLLVAGITATFPAAAGLVAVTEAIELPVPPSAAWAAIGDFMGWQAWHPAFAGTELLKGAGSTTGTVRLLTARDGARFTEELVSYNPMARRYQYRIIESPAPVSSYVSTLEVRPGNGGGSTVVWSSTFWAKPGTTDDDAKKAISAIYRLGLDNLAQMHKPAN